MGGGEEKAVGRNWFYFARPCSARPHFTKWRVPKALLAMVKDDGENRALLLAKAWFCPPGRTSRRPLLQHKQKPSPGVPRDWLGSPRGHDACLGWNAIITLLLLFCLCCLGRPSLESSERQGQADQQTTVRLRGHPGRQQH